MRRPLSALLLVACAGCAAPRPSPRADVELVTDALGITHVYARSDEDAFFGAGYAMARDRLFQMELFRRRALGTSAELLGERALRDDAFSRVVDFRRLGAADAARVRAEHPAEYRVFEAWTAGVNLRIAELREGRAPRPYGLGPGELDLVPEPWRVEDAFIVGKLLAFGLSSSLESELLATVLRNLVPKTARTLPIMLPAYDTFPVPLAQPPGPNDPKPAPPRRLPPPPPRPLDPAGLRGFASFAPDNGSNNWAVAGALTDTGRPYVCGDPHQPLSSPTRLYPLHMSSKAGGGTLDVIGFAFVGTPTVELGHNDRIGWTATTNFADVMDLWDVETDGPLDHVLLGDGPHPTRKRVERIRARTDAGFVEEELIVHEVPGYGVLLPESILPLPKYYVAQGELLFNWTGFRPTREALKYLALDRAQSIDDFERAIQLADVGAVNFIAADAREIAYGVHAAVPDRGDPSSHPMPWHVLDGDDAEGLWTRGDLPAARMPRDRAPARGYLFTANTDPFGFTADGNPENDPFYYGSFYSVGLRAFRIGQALEALAGAGRKLGRADMEALQRDLHSVLADTLIPKLDTQAASPEAQALHARLAAWDRAMRRDAAEPVIFVGLAWFAARRAFLEPLTADLFDAIAERSPPFLLGQLRNVVEQRFAAWADYAPGGVAALLAGALEDTAAWLKTRFPDGAYTLGALQAAGFDNTYGGRLDAGRTPTSGFVDTLWVAEAPFFDGGQPRELMTAETMSLYRMVIGFAGDGTPEATVDFARGTSEDPDSPRFSDQHATWAEALHVPLPFREADVEAQARERTVLKGN